MHEVVVFDTNVLISAILSSRGAPFQCVALAKTGPIRSITCREILDEFAEKLFVKFGYSEDQSRAAASEIEKLSAIIGISHTVKVVSDPDDDKVLECAVVGHATHVVTGDKKHLLPLGTYQGIRIVSPAEFLKLVANAGGQPAP
jgi:putative PIN family toxin of toxin-antitoxin system